MCLCLCVCVRACVRACVQAYIHPPACLSVHLSLYVCLSDCVITPHICACRLCCVLAVNMMVYLRLITSSQSGTSLHNSHQGDMKFDDLKL